MVSLNYRCTCRCIPAGWRRCIGSREKSTMRYRIDISWLTGSQNSCRILRFADVGQGNSRRWSASMIHFAPPTRRGHGFSNHLQFRTWNNALGNKLTILFSIVLTVRTSFTSSFIQSNKIFFPSFLFFATHLQTWVRILCINLFYIIIIWLCDNNRPN